VPEEDLDRPDLADVAGQSAAKRALEIAAAGGHHLFLLGAPGAGKTMLAERLPGLLPPLSDEEALEVTAVQSVAGALTDRPGLVRRPPFQAPHHTASTAALVGGGSHLARPGAISLAHHGILFLDEVSEFSPRTLDALRQPLEAGTVTLSRGGGVITYPARFQLVLAANPCACARPGPQCTCSALVRRRHELRLSGPLMDRIDLRLTVDPVAHTDLVLSTAPRRTSAAAAGAIATARSAARARWTGTPWRCNADVPGVALRSGPWALPASVLRPVTDQLERGALSARGFDRVLRVGWTIADLDGAPAPTPAHLNEALFFRIGPADRRAA
jgi:magnesium chelatase family protein